MATYNALKYTQNLEAAGFSRTEAEATIHMVLETMDDNFATKHDLKYSEHSLRTEMKLMEQRLRHEMREMEARLTIKMGAMLVASIAIMEYLKT